MPELPEVETTRRGIAAAMTGDCIAAVVVREPRLRWRLPGEFAAQLRGQSIRAVRRRAKYLLIDLERGCLIVHLGMSGSLRVLPAMTIALKHDHVDLILNSGACLRFNDPRRFGSMHYTTEAPEQHALLRKLAPEPLENDFNAAYLAAKAKRRKVAMKQFVMNGNLVVGVGNIYASEALFRAGIRPSRRAGRVKKAEFAKLVKAIKTVLSAAIRSGGTTLRDYVNAEGTPGYFRQKLFVYDRKGQPCRKCGTAIRQIAQGQRSTYYCPTCQT
ncbi:MAG TPA: bifunctional DNA-formamidopyrimidine glycosylase/DNA-(apurinic or apyrimidinic site) lyase [Steroidobacteraceae bacterium]|nr:bifunctional DNA-formamidopyrimidine glycosylase/DNA-(apurinic or apyrimidinic site) lyase [Steroidobacteraceae bacterium]